MSSCTVNTCIVGSDCWAIARLCLLRFHLSLISWRISCIPLYRHRSRSSLFGKLNSMPHSHWYPSLTSSTQSIASSNVYSLLARFHCLSQNWKSLKSIFPLFGWARPRANDCQMRFQYWLESANALYYFRKVQVAPMIKEWSLPDRSW